MFEEGAMIQTTDQGHICLQVSKGKSELSFYSLPEFEEWKRGTANWHTWKVKYYKGLFLLLASLAVCLFEFRKIGVENCQVS